jgi:hypothetical protein
MRKSKGQQPHADPEEHHVQPTTQTLQQEIKLIHNAAAYRAGASSLLPSLRLLCIRP